jgi:outer membrane protein
LVRNPQRQHTFMKKIIFSVCLLFSTIFFAGAQSTGSQASFSLQQAIEYAYAHQSAYLNALLDEQISAAHVKEIVGIGLPQISGSFDLKDFVEIPTSFIPAEFFGGESGDFIPVKFGTRYQASAGISASQLVFDPTYLIGVKATKGLRELASKTTQRTKIETAVAVSKAYYNVLVSRERMLLLDANVLRVKKLKDDTQALYDNGFVEKVDLDRIVLAYNNIVTEKENVSRLLMLGEYLLKYQIGMDIYSAVTLSDSLSDEQVRNITVSAEKPDVTKRIEYSLLQTNKDLQGMNLKRYKAGYIPSIFAYGSVSANAQRSKFDIFDTGERWYPIGIIGGTLQWNLFDGLQRERKIRQANLAIKKADLDLQNITLALSLEAENGRTNLQNAIASLKSQKANLELANEVVRISKLKYDQGIGSNLEVVNAETSLKEALTNYYSALYDALVAKVDLDKAMGTIQ